MNTAALVLGTQVDAGVAGGAFCLIRLAMRSAGVETEFGVEFADGTEAKPAVLPLVVPVNGDAAAVAVGSVPVFAFGPDVTAPALATVRATGFCRAAPIFRLTGGWWRMEPGRTR